jgi:Protein of unknown function (DUF3072)
VRIRAVQQLASGAATSEGCQTSTTEESTRLRAGTHSTMTDAASSPEKPTDEWVTGDEPMTGPQASYLETLARDAGEEVPRGLTKAEASREIDRLRRLSDRVQESVQDDAGSGSTGGGQGELDIDESSAAQLEQVDTINEAVAERGDEDRPRREQPGPA